MTLMSFSAGGANCVSPSSFAPRGCLANSDDNAYNHTLVYSLTKLGSVGMRSFVLIFRLFLVATLALPVFANDDGFSMTLPPADESAGSTSSQTGAAASDGSSNSGANSRLSPAENAAAMIAAPGSSTTNSTGSGTGSGTITGTTATLFGGVSHTDKMQHVAHTLDKHRKTVLLKSETAQQDVVATLPSPGPLQGSAKQNQGAYLPLNGIAQPDAEATKPLTGQVQKFTQEWFLIPHWLAGKWEKAGDLTVSITDLKTGSQIYPNEWTENEQESTWGHQADAAGNIWHVNFLPSEKDGKSDGRMVRFLVITQKCEKTDDSALITRTQYVVSESNFQTGQPIDMFQQESLNHYMMTPQREVMNESTNRVFDYSGQAVRDGHLQTRFSKTAEFAPTATINGVDLKESLNDYLSSHGMLNLLSK